MALAEREILAGTREEAPKPYRWTRDQFHQMDEAGLFEGQRVILIDGEIIGMPPVSALHCGIITLASEVLRSHFGDGFFVREEKSFDVGKATDP